MKKKTVSILMAALCVTGCGGGGGGGGGGGAGTSASTSGASSSSPVAPASTPATPASTTTATITAGSIPSAPGQSQVTFSGYVFNVRNNSGNPGPNVWSSQNVWVDSYGYLHLKISNNKGMWSSAEISTNQTFGFGTFQFKVIGHPETMDKNVVLGLFPYTTPAVGPDGTNEIDIEFTTWGGTQSGHGNWTVWPAKTGHTKTSYQFDMSANSGESTHRFTWSSQSILFQALTGLTDTDTGQYASWVFAPTDYTNLVPQNAIPLDMNLWLYQGQPPSDGAEVELVISEFKYMPAAN